MNYPTLKIADFGFARHLESQSLAETLCGSPLYMAPEILSGKRYDAKADLWSAGAVLYESLTGRPPYRAGSHIELLHKIENGGDVIKFGNEFEIGADMKALIRGLLKKDPVERMGFEEFFSNELVRQAKKEPSIPSSVRIPRSNEDRLFEFSHPPSPGLMRQQMSAAPVAPWRVNTPVFKPEDRSTPPSPRIMDK